MIASSCLQASPRRDRPDRHLFLCSVALQVVQEYERAVIFRLGRLLADGSRGPGTNAMQCLLSSSPCYFCRRHRRRVSAGRPSVRPSFSRSVGRSASVILSLSLCKMYYQNSSGASNDFLPPSCSSAPAASNARPPGPAQPAHPSVLHQCQDIRRKLFSHSFLFSFHSLL